MTDKAPYGGMVLFPESGKDGPWTKLNTIQEHLEDEQPIPRELAIWLGEAIRRSAHTEDGGELLRQLGIIGRQGKKPTDYPADIKFKWGKRVCQIEDAYTVDGASVREAKKRALDQALSEFLSVSKTSDEPVSEQTMKNWRALYRNRVFVSLSDPENPLGNPVKN